MTSKISGSERVDSRLQVRRMEMTDTPALMELKKFARWNQSKEDWASFMQVEPEGCFVGTVGGQVIASATAFNYDSRFGWIGMILVDPDYRRQGIATRMMSEAVAYLEENSCACQKLDATSDGALVYEKIGFQSEYPVERWRREAGPIPRLEGRSGRFERLDLSRIELVSQWDAKVFGASRKRLLQSYAVRRPGFYLGNHSAVEGFVFGRQGSDAFQVGPLVAKDGSAARELLEEMLFSLPAIPVIVDLVSMNREAVGLMESFGFAPARVLQRMYRGENHFPGHPNNVYCLAGFEFG